MRRASKGRKMTGEDRENNLTGDGETGMFGMKLLLASLSVLFAAGIVIYILVRTRAEAWPPEGWPGTHPLIWADTALLLISSGTMHGALAASRKGAAAPARWLLSATMALGLAFLAGQAWVWYDITGAGEAANKNMFAFAFYFLSGLHAAHLLGGLAYLAITMRKAFAAADIAAAGPSIKYCAIYWHFLDIAWIILCAALFII